MIYEEHNRPGEVVVALSLDSVKDLYPLLGISRERAVIDRVSDVYKEAVKASRFSIDHVELWERLQHSAANMLDPDTSNRLIKWNHDAYTGYHPAQPDMLWGSVLLQYARGSAGWPDVGQSIEEQRHFDEFAEFFLAEWDWEGFDRTLDEIHESGALTPWDRDIYMRYGFVPFDEDGNDPLLAIQPVRQGQALRTAIADFGFAARPDFPHQKLQRAAQIEADAGWMPEGTELSLLTEIT